MEENKKEEKNLPAESNKKEDSFANGIINYALSEYKNCMHLFIYGDEDTKVKRIMKKYDLTQQKAH